MLSDHASHIQEDENMQRTAMILLPLLLVGVCLTAAPAEKPLASKKLIRALTDEVSGELAYRYTVLVSQYDRIQACEGFHDAALMLKEKLDVMGYDDAAIEGWPSNGSTYYYTYQTPIGWRARSAELWMTSPKRDRLCSFEEIPLNLIKHSGPAEGVEAELIDVGAGDREECYLGKDVKGRIVLATGRPGSVNREAVVKRGALGMVGWYPPDVRPGYPNMIRYTAYWPKWEERDQIGFGFNVSKNQGWLLKKMLDEGQKVVLKADVDSEFYETEVEVLSASFPGTEEPEKEILICGHLCHPTPSANDNGSGSGGMLEMARALKKMVAKGWIDPPKRTIRFLWVPEFYGTIPYIKAHLERTRNTLAVINCDMIGEDLHLTGGMFNIMGTPHSLPSYLNDTVANFTHLVAGLNLTSMNGSKHPFAYNILPYSGGSDHVIFNDGALKVPAVMFNHGDTFHHTSLDTPEKVDASELRRVCFIGLGASCYLANATCGAAQDMARLITRNGLGRVAADAYDGRNAMFEAEEGEALFSAYKQALNVTRHAAMREAEAVRSTKVFARRDEVKASIENSIAPIKALHKSLESETHEIYKSLCAGMGISPRKASVLNAEEKKMSRIVPVRAADFVCPLQRGYVEAKVGPDALTCLDLGRNAPYEILNFVDGKRSVLDITRAVSAEYGPLSCKDVYAFFDVLAEAELMTLKMD